MTPDAFGEEIKAALVPHADAQRALAMRAYMRDHFEFIGVPTPLRRQAVLPSTGARGFWNRLLTLLGVDPLGGAD